MNFQGIPSATSALNWTIISLPQHRKHHPFLERCFQGLGLLLLATCILSTVAVFLYADIFFIAIAKMANHGASALLIMSLLVALTLADARLTVQYSTNGGYAVTVPALTCNKVHEVQVDETCFSLAQSAGLTEEQFLGFNPNINCAKVFLGQWVCLNAVAA